MPSVASIPSRNTRAGNTPRANMMTLPSNASTNSMTRHMSPAMSRLAGNLNHVSHNLMPFMTTAATHSEEYYENTTSIGNVQQRQRILATTSRQRLDDKHVAVSKNITSSIQSVEIQKSSPQGSTAPNTPMDDRKPAALEYNSEEDEQDIAPIQLKNHAELISLQQRLIPPKPSHKGRIPPLKQSFVEKDNRVKFDDDSTIPKRSDDLHRSQMYPDLTNRKMLVDRGAYNTIDVPPSLPSERSQSMKRPTFILQGMPKFHIEELPDDYEDSDEDSLDTEAPNPLNVEQSEEQVNTETSHDDMPELEDVNDPLLGITPPSSPKDVSNVSTGNDSAQQVPGSFLEALTGKSNEHSNNENEWTTVQSKKHPNPKRVQSPQSVQSNEAQQPKRSKESTTKTLCPMLSPCMVKRAPSEDSQDDAVDVSDTATPTASGTPVSANTRHARQQRQQDNIQQPIPPGPTPAPGRGNNNRRNTNNYRRRRNSSNSNQSNARSQHFDRAKHE